MSILNGLVLMGGASTRMEQDKASLKYHGLPQYEHIYRMMQPFCKEVYLSTSRLDYTLPAIPDLAIYQHIGPMAGILSAYHKIQTSWLVIAIDYPWISEIDVETLISERSTAFDASVFHNEESGFFEPFLGIYEKSFFTNTSAYWASANYSMQQILKQAHVCRVRPHSNETLKSIDTPDDYNLVKNKINDTKGNG